MPLSRSCPIPRGGSNIKPVDIQFEAAGIPDVAAEGLPLGSFCAGLGMARGVEFVGRGLAPSGPPGRMGLPDVTSRYRAFDARVGEKRDASWLSRSIVNGNGLDTRIYTFSDQGRSGGSTIPVQPMEIRGLAAARRPAILSQMEIDEQHQSRLIRQVINIGARILHALCAYESLIDVKEG
ncbi:hypothetical protein CF326_g7292 [Tilletia indica]|uniref:Uncharacterized protein n=1 Tax=Tilletia indica TaxID=43049 RepID=A0A177T5B0_9BASI|nr:hypothetical protein CF326_g7292 [Tilletia indica]KAE8244193.1 hypothetical protein A4X13_0g6770 [Tilletia indica]